MSRDFSCQTGRQPYKKKTDAEAADSSGRAKRCDRCRWWHRADDHVRRGGGTRK